MGGWDRVYRDDTQMAPALERGSMVNEFLDRHRSLGIAGFVALLVLLSVPCAWLGSIPAVSPYPHRTPAFPIQDVLLDESVFPEGFRAVRPFDPEDRLPAEQVARHFLTEKCHPLMVGAGQQVYRFYGGAQSAAEAYPQEIAIWLSPNRGDWSIPPELSYESVVADQYRFGCYPEQETATVECQAVGRYGEYIVLFDAELDPDHPECLSFTDLERILVAIDERMALYLGQDTQ